MPHEKINYQKTPDRFEEDKETKTASFTPGEKQLVIGWNEIGWVQVSLYPQQWKDTGDGDHVDLTPQELDLLIKTLRRAKRQAYRKGNRASGFEDGPKVGTRPLFKEKIEIPEG